MTQTEDPILEVVPDAAADKTSSADVIGEYKKEVTHGDHGIKGDKTNITKRITFIVALAWALFQLSTASWLLLDSLFVKSFHLAFAMTLVYLNLPTLKSGTKSRWDLRILLAMKRVTRASASVPGSRSAGTSSSASC